MQEPEEVVALVRRLFVNRTDRYGSYRKTKRGIAPCVLPLPWHLRSAERAGKLPPFLGPEQIRAHLLGEGMPIGCHAISNDDRSKWIALDIDKHDEEIPDEAVLAARDAVIECARVILSLECTVENSGRGGWHVWIHVAKPVPAFEAFAVATYLRKIGGEAWRRHHPEPHIDRFPSSETRHSGEKGQGGKWLRVPGRHHSRDHESSILLPDGTNLTGSEMWLHFERVAAANTLDRWRAAVEFVTSQVKQPPPEPPRTQRAERASSNKTRRAPAALSCEYDGWSFQDLTTRLLSRGERRKREIAIIQTGSRVGMTAAEVERGISTLYEVAAGDSEDLAIAGRREALIQAIPALVQRFMTDRPFRWATWDEFQAARTALLNAVKVFEDAGVKGWSVAAFAKWFDALVQFLVGRARNQGTGYLARTMIPTLKRGDFYLRQSGGAHHPVKLDHQLVAAVRHWVPMRTRRWMCMTSKPTTRYLAHLYLLASTPVPPTGTPVMKIVRPAVKSTPTRKGSPWTLDFRGFPLPEQWPTSVTVSSCQAQPA